MSRTVILNCQTCAAAVAATSVESYIQRCDGFAEEVYRVTMFRCPRCDDPFVCRELQVGYDPDWGGNDAPVWADPVVLYPGDPTQLDASVPKPIADSFLEARKCFRAASPTATAIMCRRTIEGLCQQQGALRGSLQAKLQHLRDTSVIESRLFDWADALRLAGNDAAHDVNETTTNEDARDLLEFTRAILEYVYTFNDAFQRFRARRDVTDVPSPS